MVASALFAGFSAGLLAAALQFVFVEPILLTAELYESGAIVHVPAAGAPHDHASHDHPETTAETTAVATDAVVATTESAAHDAAPESGAAPAAPIDWPRHGLTVLFTALVYCGYALVLVAGFVLAEQRGHRVTARAGLLWGTAGFIAVHFAPAAGMPPELPGMAGGDLTGRQLWWAGTVLATGLGLWLIAFGKTGPAWALGALLILMPHMVGAPLPAQMTGPAPPELAALFAGRTLAVGMAVWVVLGWLGGGAWDRMRA